MSTSAAYASSTADLRRLAIGRRISTSEPIARVIAEHTFGPLPDAPAPLQLGGLAAAIVADLARRTGRKLP